MTWPAWLEPMDRGDEQLLDRAYRRRLELLGQPGVRWVRMTLESRGVSFVLEESTGARRTEWMPRNQAVADGEHSDHDHGRT